MLILTRRIGESIKIGDEVTVTLLGVKKSQAKLGFVANPDIPVHREEIYKKILEDFERKVDKDTNKYNNRAE